MLKLFHIVFDVVMLGIVFMIPVSTHYCGGNLDQLSHLAIQCEDSCCEKEEMPEDCGHEDMRENCCQDQVLLFTKSSGYNIAIHPILQENSAQNYISFSYNVYNFLFNKSITDKQSLIHKIPPGSKTSVYIWIQTFIL